MPTFSVLVEVKNRPGIADPQGATVEKSLPTLGFTDVSGVHIGKAIRLNVEGDEVARQLWPWPEPRGHSLVKAGLAVVIYK